MAKKLSEDQASTSNVKPEVIQKHFREIHKLSEEAKRVASELQTAFKTAKSDGVPIDALKMARKLGKMDSLEAQHFLRQMTYVARSLGMPFATQIDMFSDVQPVIGEEEADAHAEWDAATAGHDAAVSGGLRGDNPHEPGSMLFDAWDRAWIGGDKQREKAVKAGKPEVKKPRGRKAKGAAIVDGAEAIH